tara:strand:+ start:288 stop:716 length:429 start_codon:yes stop_codon:yes gene_type:complete
MSWKKIIKAPTMNRDGRFGYRGNRKYSDVDDTLMAQIIKDLDLPEKDEDGDTIDYYENYDDFQLDISADIEDHDITITVKPKGEIHIYDDDGDKKLHTFTEDKIKIEDSSLKIEIDEKMTLDFEFIDYSNKTLYLEVTEYKR